MTPRPPSLPIWTQILGVVAGALIAAQVVTLALTLLMPPAPPQLHSLADIANALQDQAPARGQGRPLIRKVESAPPSLDSPGWVVSPSTTAELARLLGAPEADVRILFYAPPPLAGTGPPPPRGPRIAADGRPVRQAGYAPITLALAGPPPGGMGGPMGGMGAPGMGPGAMGPGPMPPGGMGPGGIGGMSPGGMGPSAGPTSGARRPSPSSASMPAPTSSPASAPAAPGGGNPAHAGPGASAPQGPGPAGRPPAPLPGPAIGRLPRSPLDAAVFRAPDAPDIAPRSPSRRSRRARPPRPRRAAPPRPTPRNPRRRRRRSLRRSPRRRPRPHVLCGTRPWASRSRRR